MASREATATSAPEPEYPGTAFTLALVTGSILGFVTSVFMIAPLLVDLAKDFHVSVGRAGLLATAMAIPWALGSPFAGFFSDRLGRRPLIVLALGGVGVLYLVASTAGSFLTLLIIRVCAGVLGSAGPTSVMASVGDLFPRGRRATAMGWLNMGFSLASVTTVPLVGVIGGLFGWRWGFVATGGALIVLSVFIRFAFPPGRPSPAEGGALATYHAVLEVPRLVNVLLANVAERSMFTMVTVYLPAFLMVRYVLNAAEVAPALAVVAVGAIVGNLVGGWLGDHLHRPAVYVAGQALAAALGLALFSLPLGLLGAMLLGALFGLADAASRPCFLAFAADLAPGHRGAMFGLVGLTNQGGLVLGSAVGALVIEFIGYEGLAVVAVCQGCAAAALFVPLSLHPDRR